MANLSVKIKNLPQKPGVYLFKNERGEVLYVGKAKNLKNRVRTYFHPHPTLPPQAHPKSDYTFGEPRQGGGRVEAMIQNIADIDYTVVSSEIESLILENNLIKQYQPRFNVLMRDDKNYQFIKIDFSVEIPQIYPVRQLEGKRQPNKYFGPYTSGLSVRETLRMIKNIFHLCRNKKITNRPCFAYHLGRCPGVCIGKITLDEYRKTFVQIEEFLAHRQTAVLRELKQEMADAARKRKFEKAGLARDKIRSLEHLWQKQKIVSAKNENHDYLGIYLTPSDAVVSLFMVRGGKVVHTEHFSLEHKNSQAAEILERFVLQYYTEASDLPKEIHLPAKLPNETSIEQLFSRMNKSRFRFRVPTRGRKNGLVKLATENAALFYEREMTSFFVIGGSALGREKILDELQTLLNLPKTP